MSELVDKLSSGKAICLLKFEDKYKISSNDLLKKLERVLNSFNDNSLRDLKMWFHFISQESQNAFYPSYDEDFYRNYPNDYLFKIDEHIVQYILFLIRNVFNKDNFEEYLVKCINFIKEIKKNKKQYSNDTISLILSYIGYELFKKVIVSDKCLEFYHDNLLKNAEKGDKGSMRTLGYEYYEGTNTFPLDPFQSEYWLKKYYDATGDSDVAITLGYIYYYGRTNNGIPEKEKAFQFFAIGHFAGHYYEATYKLADCYVKGYGTPICYEAAYNLVTSIYKDTLNIFLYDSFSKFADVALRLGRYFLEGIHVKKDLYESYLYFLEAKVALNQRLKAGEYIGDRGLAYKVNNLLNFVKDQLDIPQHREFKLGGYVTPVKNEVISNCKIELSLIDDVTLHIKATKRKNDENSFLNIKPFIYFGEKSRTIEYCLLDFQFDDELLDGFDGIKITSISLENEHLAVFEGKTKDGNKTKICGMFDKIVVIPQTLQNPGELYNLIKVNIDGKLYQYLCKNDVHENDDVDIIFNETLVTTKVVEIKKVYEDELPLPLEKMNQTINKLN